MNESKTCLTDGSPVSPDHRELDPTTGLQKGYVVLCPEERAKGFVRPVRLSYRHIGKRPKYPLRDLTDEERERYGQFGYVAFEVYPESESPATGRFWTKKQLSSGCGMVTTMEHALAATYARDPKFYSATFCSWCRNHFAVEEFTWVSDGSVVGS